MSEAHFHSYYSDVPENIQPFSYQVSECQRPVDLIFRSSDNVLIGAHQFNLEHFSEVFPAASAVIVDLNEPVDLSETSKTLNDLFHFMHNGQQPDLNARDSQSLFDLAQAAEKYIVHAAIGACSATILFV